MKEPARLRMLTASLRSRVKPEEKKLLMDCAQQTGATLSQWTRKTLLEAVGGWKDKADEGVGK